MCECTCTSLTDRKKIAHNDYSVGAIENRGEWERKSFLYCSSLWFHSNPVQMIWWGEAIVTAGHKWLSLSLSLSFKLLLLPSRSLSPPLTHTDQLSLLLFYPLFACETGNHKPPHRHCVSECLLLKEAARKRSPRDVSSKKDEKVCVTSLLCNFVHIQMLKCCWQVLSLFLPLTQCLSLSLFYLN